MSLRMFDTTALALRLRSDSIPIQDDRRSLTLEDGPGLRIVLIALQAGKVIPPHQVEGPLSVQVIEGRMKFSTDTESIVLEKDQIVTLEAKVRHALEALAPTVFLLTRVAGHPQPTDPIHLPR